MTATTRTVVTFRSEKFNSNRPQEYFINPCCFGDDLCRWLIAQLTADGIGCDPEPGQEDFGWYFNFRLGNDLYCLVCGFRPADGDCAGVWVAWLERSTGFLASLFGGRNRNIDASAPAKIHKVLARCAEISHIRWHIKEDFDRGNEEAGTESPDQGV